MRWLRDHALRPAPPSTKAAPGYINETGSSPAAPSAGAREATRPVYASEGSIGIVQKVKPRPVPLLAHHIAELAGYALNDTVLVFEIQGIVAQNDRDTSGFDDLQGCCIQNRGACEKFEIQVPDRHRTARHATLDYRRAHAIKTPMHDIDGHGVFWIKE